METKRRTFYEGLKVARIEPAYQQVAGRLRQQILDGRLVSGARLPNETDLSALFGVGRGTVREALRSLASEGLVTTSRGVSGGTVIARPEPERVVEYLETALGLLSGTEHVGVNDLLEAREFLELPAVLLAAQRRTDDDVDALWAALEIERAQPATALEGHQAVHDAVLRASHNPLLVMMTRPVFMVLRTRFLRDRADQSLRGDVDHDHVRIIEAIEAGDGQGADTAMRHHLETLRALYGSLDGGAP